MDGADRSALPTSWRLGLAAGLGVGWMLILVAGRTAISVAESSLLGPAAFLLYLTGPALTSLLFRSLLPKELRGRWTVVVGLAGVLGYAITCVLTVVVPAVLELVQGARLSLGTASVVWMLILLSVSPALAALGAFAATAPDRPAGP
jgi:hypothetical protein